MIRASARKRANLTRERAEAPIMRRDGRLDRREGYVSLAAEAAVCCSGCTAAPAQAMISDWARNPADLPGERADLLIKPAPPPPGGAARPSGRPLACPQRMPEGPQRLTGQGAAKRLAKRRAMPLSWEGRPRTLRGAARRPAHDSPANDPGHGAEPCTGRAAWADCVYRRIQVSAGCAGRKLGRRDMWRTFGGVPSGRAGTSSAR
jgi:hypothetical protein